MTIKEAMAAAEEAREYWQLMLPDVEAPELRTFLMWTGQFSNAAVVRGIHRAARKFTKLKGTATPMTANDAYRYCTSVIAAEARGQAQ